MVFSSQIFLFYFLPIVLIIYNLVNRRLKNLFLCIASLFFYAWGEPVYVLIMLFSTVFDFCNGIFMEKYPEHKKKILILSVVGNLGILFTFKYLGLFIESINHLGIDIPVVNLRLPIGISFYTFQTMSYSIDVYRNRVKVSHNIIDFGLFVSSFPQLIAGPIVKYIDIEKELESRDDSLDRVGDAVFLFLKGLILKVILANTFAEAITKIDISSSFAALILSWFLFSLQIYYDFHGYSTMAIALGRMFGFNFPQNFNFPYSARSITDFWNRWHISLSSWFKEYVYIPLGGNRVSVARHIFNLFVVWALTGFWHGASYNFLLWGIYYFIILTLEKYVFGKNLSKANRFITTIYVAAITLVGWGIFMADSTEVLFSYTKSFHRLYDFNSLGVFVEYILYIIVGIFFSFPHKNKLPDRITKTLLIILGVISVALVVSGSYNPFLYFRF